MVILGEYHGATPIVQLQTQIQQTMASALPYPPASMPGSGVGMNMNTTQCESQSQSQQLEQQTPNPKVRVILEHFSMDMQGMLNQFHSRALDTRGLLQAYKNVGTEGHNLNPYIPALESAVDNDRIRIYGGFLPRTYARILMREGPEKAIKEASDAGFISKDERLDGTDAHYNYFESLLTGRNIHMDPNGDSATNRFRAKMFPAQIIKDASMAFCVNSLDRILNITGQDRMLLVCGVGHMLYWNGVPERILANATESNVVKKKDDILRIACLPVAKGALNLSSNSNVDTDTDTYSTEIISTLKNEYGSSDHDAADICFLYEEVSEEEPEIEMELELDDNAIREETKAAYDKVGNTAHLEGGDLKKARGILASLHYTPEEIEYAGKDAVNYQGVGCPHRHANIKAGDSVLDLGSGLGIDSLIATNAVGSGGRVVGVDLSHDCVRHASRRAKERGVDDTLSFVQSPIESIGSKKLGLSREENYFDVIISNGAFCLLPNKKDGFAECFQLLKSGGNIAICTTVIKDKLEGGVEWPLCMQTFARIDELVPMLEELGFQDIEIDLSDSLMEVPVPEQPEVDDDEAEGEEGDAGEFARDHDHDRDAAGEEASGGRFKVHNEEGESQFRHLQKFDMNMLCARVVIKATKV